LAIFVRSSVAMRLLADVVVRILFSTVGILSRWQV
jgi:hypothetical protein